MVQDRKIAQMKEKGRGGIGRRILKNQKSQKTPVSSATNAMFPAYERVVLREGDYFILAFTIE